MREKMMKCFLFQLQMTVTVTVTVTVSSPTTKVGAPTVARQLQDASPVHIRHMIAHHLYSCPAAEHFCSAAEAGQTKPKAQRWGGPGRVGSRKGRLRCHGAQGSNSLGEGGYARKQKARIWIHNIQHRADVS
jgi:hypothetical protein